MASTAAIIISLAYVIGLFLTAFPQTFLGIQVGAIALLFSGLIAALVMPTVWRTGVKPGVWLIAGVVGCLAVFYLQWRLPEATAHDISRWAESDTSVKVAVSGAIETSPRLTRSQKIQFELEAIAASPVGETSTPPKAVEGHVYVTVPLLQGTGLIVGQQVTVTGSLYQPKPAANPGGFDFQAYLGRSGIFAGLSGETVELKDNQQTGLLQQVQQWQTWVRQRIVRSQVMGAGAREGGLISAMVMGRNGVDLDFDLQDQFSKAGLAHALAASGFQVSLLMGILLAVTKRLAAKTRLWLGVGAIAIYIGLTGIEPAVLRAGLMGLAALIALTQERKVKPLGSLLLAAVLILVYDPLWIWNLGFQFSFLATLGLLVTVPVLTKWLDWVPTAIAPLIAVPAAAYLWTLPLQLYGFGIVSPYSIPVNILTTPLITVLSLGGMVSALAGLIWMPAGSFLAWGLSYPAQWLIALAQWGNRLPGSAIAIGTIALGQLAIIYVIFMVVWWQKRWHRYWWMGALISLSLVAVPVWHNYTNLFQITVLSTANQPILVMQDRGRHRKL